MTEQQEHLKNLFQQRAELEESLTKNRELYLKVQGAIEYLTATGVELPVEEQPEPETEPETETVEE